MLLAQSILPCFANTTIIFSRKFVSLKMQRIKDFFKLIQYTPITRIFHEHSLQNTLFHMNLEALLSYDNSRTYFNSKYDRRKLELAHSKICIILTNVRTPHRLLGHAPSRRLRACYRRPRLLVRCSEDVWRQRGSIDQEDRISDCDARSHVSADWAYKAQPPLLATSDKWPLGSTYVAYIDIICFIHFPV